MSSPFRVGLVGANPERGWGRDAHLEPLRRSSDFVLSAVSARTQAQADAAARAFGAQRGVGDSLALVRDPDIDLVVVTVKVPEHRAIVLAALDAGKHVYCEWPLGADIDEAQEMAAAVRPGMHAVIGLQALSSPIFLQAAQLVRSGAIGKPLVLRVYGSAGAWGPETSPHYAYLQDKRNGATLETIGGGHALAPVEALVGRYVEVDARNSTLRKRVRVAGADQMVDRTCADHMLVLGLHESGCVSTFEMAGGVSERRALFDLQGETGWLRVSGVVPGACQIAQLQIEASVPTPPPRSVAPELSGPPANIAEVYARLAEDLRSGQKRLPDFDAAVHLTRLLQAIDVASESGVRQHLKP